MNAEVFRVHAEVERTHWWFAARRQILRAVVETIVPPDRSRRVLDLGCGVGATAPAFHPDYAYIGYEPSAVAVDFARTAQQGVEFRVGTAETVAADLSRADVVLLTDVIEHVEGDRALLADTLRPMPAGSWLLVTVPAGMQLWSPHDVALGQNRRYDRETLRDACSGLGARFAMLSYFNSRLYPAVRATRWVTRESNRSVGPGGTDLSVPPIPMNAALRRIFAGEAKRLTTAIGGTGSAYGRGVSLMALLQRQHSVTESMSR